MPGRAPSWRSLADLLWPRLCAGCQRERGPLCPGCAASLSPIDERRACGRCALSLGPGPGPCPDCRRLRAAAGEIAFRRVTSVYEYGGALAPALHRLKWQGRDDLAAPLGALLGPALAGLAPGCDVLVPMPLHGARLRERGYNQAALLLAAALPAAGRPRPQVLYDVLLREGAAPPAVAAGFAARQARVRGAFVVPPRAAALLAGRRVLLCDDVLTTGATAQAAAAALVKAGAAVVEVLTLCRTCP